MFPAPFTPVTDVTSKKVGATHFLMSSLLGCPFVWDFSIDEGKAQGLYGIFQFNSWQRRPVCEKQNINSDIL
jgi:hypothetical protein